MKIKKRNTLWFNQYEYCGKISMRMSYMLRDLDHDQLARMIERQQQWAKRGSNMKFGIGINLWSISEEDQTRLHRACDYFLEHKTDRKLVFSGNLIYVYTNDLTHLEDLLGSGILEASNITISRVELVGRSDSINLHQANHAFRTYLRGMSVTEQQQESLRSYLEAQEGVRLGPALEKFIQKSGKDAARTYHNTRTQDYFFLDHDNMGTLGMLNLVVPGIIRKTLPITAYK